MVLVGSGSDPVLGFILVVPDLAHFVIDYGSVHLFIYINFMKRL